MLKKPLPPIFSVRPGTNCTFITIYDEDEDRVATITLNEDQALQLIGQISQSILKEYTNVR